jgi:hypothetical protein
VPISFFLLSMHFLSVVEHERRGWASMRKKNAAEDRDASFSYFIQRKKKA